eukprot:m.934349 g.934349  ORF g.934349 m.934349 type:complete len:192 (-) comp205914_c0_seq1:5-580(-)
MQGFDIVFDNRNIDLKNGSPPRIGFRPSTCPPTPSTTVPPTSTQSPPQIKRRGPLGEALCPLPPRSSNALSAKDIGSIVTGIVVVIIIVLIVAYMTCGDGAKTRRDDVRQWFRHHNLDCMSKEDTNGVGQAYREPSTVQPNTVQLNTEHRDASELQWTNTQGETPTETSSDTSRETAIEGSSKHQTKKVDW